MDNQNKQYRLGLYEKSMPNFLSWEEKLNIVKETGFDYLEMSIDESDERLSRLDSNMDDLLLAIQKTKVPVSSMCLSGHRKYPLGSHDKVIQNKSLEIMQKAIDLSEKLGVRIIQLAGYDVYYEQGDEKTRIDFIKNLKICVEMAAKKGIVLGFETMETSFMDTVEKAMYYVNIVNSPYLGVYPDIGNLKNASVIYGNEVNKDIETGKGHIFAAHLKETKPGKYREITFGQGHTEYIRNIEILKQLGVRMFVGEFWYVNNDDWKDVIQQANIFLRERIEKGILVVLKDNIRLIVTDLDGTLLNSAGDLDSEIIDLKRKINIPITFASGRNKYIIEELVEKCEVNLPYITNNGANIYVKGNCVWQFSIDHKELDYVIKLLYQKRIPFLLYSKESLFYYKTQKKLDFYRSRMEGKCDIVELDIDELVTNLEYFKLTIVNENLCMMDEICDLVNSFCKHTKMVRTEGNQYVLTHIKANKGEALKILSELTGIKVENMLVFGDNYNDLPMFEKAINSVVMSNASENIKQKANYITATNDENGVSKFIKKYLMNN